MSVEAPPPKLAAPPPMGNGLAESLIDDRLRQTRRQLRTVDVATSLLLLAIGGMAYLFLLILADHWLFTGGLGTLGRFLAWLVLLVVGGGYGYLRVLRPWLRRINPVYVAPPIEQSRPTLKNGLINFLLLRRHRQAIPEVITHEIERHAAGQLADISPEDVVDRRRATWLCYVLTAMVAIGGVYHVVSPKSPLTSVLRVLMPFSGRSAPTRVRFDDIQPGNLVEFEGQHVAVSAEVHGLRGDETPTLYFTTADRQSVDQAIPMAVPQGRYRHEATLPPDSSGLRQNLTYYLAAGDFRSPPFAITVQTAPTILVESVEYAYPDYTGLPPRTVRQQGDLRAIEGTVVTIHAKANTPIDHAEIDLGCRGLRRVRMTASRVDDRRASGHFTLRVNPDDPTLPEHDCYQLRYTDVAGREDRRPIRHQIEVIADLPPEVRLVNPPAERIRLPVNGVLPLAVHAEDPDFALREVAVRAVRGDRSLPIRPLLRTVAPSPPHQGPFEGVCRIKPAELGLKPGDEVVYWAEAADNKTPIAGRAETQRRWITIVEADENQQEKPQPKDQQDQPGDDDQKQQQEDQQGRGPEDQQSEDQPEQPGDQQQSGDERASDQQDQQQKQGKQDDQSQSPDQQEPGEQSAADDRGQQGNQAATGQEQDQKQQGQGGEQQDQRRQDQAGPSKPGESAEDQNAPGQNSAQQQPADRPSEPIDGETNPGDVIQKALEQREQEQKENSGQQSETKPTEEQGQPSDENRPSEKQGDQSASEGAQQQASPAQQRQPDEANQPQQDQQPQPPDASQQEENKKSGTCEKCGKPKSQCQCSGGQPKDNAGGSGQSGQQQPASAPGDDQRQAGQDQPGGDQQRAGGSQGNKSPPRGEDQRASDDQSAGQRQPADQQQRPDDKQPGGEGQQPGGEQKQPGGEGMQPGDKGQQPGGDDQRTKPGQQPPAAQADQSQGDKEGRALRPDEITPGMKVRPEGYTDEDPNAQAKLPQGPPGGGGQPGQPPFPPEAQPPREDPFNRDYAQKQTILALEYLKDQLAKDKPDQKLLDSLGGWTRDDLKKFTERWESMFRQAAEQGPEGQKAQARLDEAIKSLGLHRGRTELKGGATDDQLRRLRTPRRLEPPPEWEEQIRAYRRGVGRDQ